MNRGPREVVVSTDVKGVVSGSSDFVEARKVNLYSEHEARRLWKQDVATCKYFDWIIGPQTAGNIPIKIGSLNFFAILFEEKLATHVGGILAGTEQGIPENIVVGFVNDDDGNDGGLSNFKGGDG